MEYDGERLWMVLLVLGVLWFVHVWLALCETALTEVNDTIVHNKAEHDEAWKSLDEIISKPAKMRQCFAVSRIFTVAVMGILSWQLVGKKMTEFMNFQGGAFAAGLVLAVGLMVFIGVLAESFPKQIAEKYSEKLARGAVPTVRFLMMLLSPMLAIISGSTKIVCGIFGIPVTNGVDVVTEEEIRLMVDAGNETGGIEEIQSEMIHNIFTFDDVAVSEVMTHRKDITAVPKQTTAQELAELAMREGFSRIPVYDGTIDSIIGVVLIKDLLPMVGRETDCTVTDIMRKTIYVPETAKCRSMFQQMLKQKMQMAIVVDEYGGTAGMVTMEDLLEEIVGNIQDEYDDEESELIVINDNTFSIAGAADPEDILPQLGVESEMDDTYETMSAFVVHLLGRIPEMGEKPSVEQDGVRYTLQSYEDHWIHRIQAEILPKPEKEG
ncbi:MAG: hemolysin family protein [Oscillospiraceae bacterium]|nr:hemolysin family protein [Oscillospiraceae bacterium]